MKEINRLLKYEYERESKSEYVSSIGSADTFEWSLSFQMNMYV